VAPNQQPNVHFSTERGMIIMNYANVSFFVHKKIISAVERVEFVSDTMSYIIVLRGR
jgi:hypothetical protein